MSKMLFNQDKPEESRTPLCSCRYDRGIFEVRLALKVSNRLARALRKVDTWYPLEQRFRLRDIEADIVDFSRSSGHVSWLNVFAEQVADTLKYFYVGCLHATADVKNFVGAPIKRGNVRGSNIRNIDVVSNLLAVSVNDGLKASQHLLGKYRKDTGFALGTLPRPIDVSIS